MTQLISKRQKDDLDTILDGCRKNDPQAQEKLYKQCYAVFIKMCHLYAGDMDGAGIIFNNAFLRVFKNIDKYHHENRLMGWIKTIILNCCLDYVSKQHKPRFESIDTTFIRLNKNTHVRHDKIDVELKVRNKSINTDQKIPIKFNELVPVPKKPTTILTFQSTHQRSNNP